MASRETSNTTPHGSATEPTGAPPLDIDHAPQAVGADDTAALTPLGRALAAVLRDAA